MKNLNWQLPNIDPNAIAQLYVELVRSAPGGVNVWARVEGAKLHFYTVLDQKMTAESAVHAAEMRVLELYDPAIVKFHVYPDSGPLKAFIKDLAPLLQLV